MYLLPSSYIENGEPFTSIPRFTLNYAAPEILRVDEKNDPLYCKGNDIWSLGTVIYTMVVGYPPFRHKEGDNDDDTVRARILECDYDKTETWAQLSVSLKDLILKTFEMDYEQRISASEILIHDWFDPPLPVGDNGIEICLDDNESSITAGDLDSIISMDDDDDEVKDEVASQDLENECVDLLETESLPGDVQSAEENNNMKNREKNEDEETAATSDEEGLFYFDPVDSEQRISLMERFEFEPPRNLTVVVKKVSKKKTVSVNHRVPIKKRPNYFKSPDEIVVQIPIPADTSDKESVDFLGFRKNGYLLELTKSEMLCEYEDCLNPGKKRGKARLLDSEFESVTSKIELRKIWKRKEVKPIKPVVKTLRKRRAEVDLKMSPRKTRSSLTKVKELKAADEVKTVVPNIATDFLATRNVNPLASTSRTKPKKIAVVKPLRKRKTEEDGGPASSAKKRACVTSKQGQILESDDDFSTYTRSPRIRILVKESY